MAQTQKRKRYEICSVCHELSYPKMPWRVYETEINEHGVAVSNALLFAASFREEAERWARENCRRVVTCV